MNQEDQIALLRRIRYQFSRAEDAIDMAQMGLMSHGRLATMPADWAEEFRVDVEVLRSKLAMTERNI